MDSRPAQTPGSAAEPATEIPPSLENPLDHAAGWVEGLRDRACLVSELVFAEARLAATSFALMAFLALLAGVCMLGAIGLAVAGLVFGLQLAGIPLWAALVGIAALLTVVACVLARQVLRLSANLEFSATRREVSLTRTAQ